VLGISHAHAYQLVKAGDLPVIRLGAKRVRVPTDALRRMVGVED
jgi:excisionase family DNA binding protein